MYSTRDHQIFYDESHLCLIRCLQKTVETIWGPRIQEINDIIDSILDDVIKITSEKRKCESSCFLYQYNWLDGFLKQLSKQEPLGA